PALPGPALVENHQQNVADPHLLRRRTAPAQPTRPRLLGAPSPSAITAQSSCEQPAKNPHLKTIEHLRQPAAAFASQPAAGGAGSKGKSAIRRHSPRAARSACFGERAMRAVAAPSAKRQQA